MKYPIEDYWTGKTIIEVEIDCDESASASIKMGLAVRQAYLNGADLTGAHLNGADLTRADLTGAHLTGAYLTGAHLTGAYLTGAYVRGHKLVGQRPFFSIGPIGSRQDNLLGWLADDGVFVQTGNNCFFGTLEEFETVVEKKHGSSVYAMEYRAAIVLIRTHAKLWMPKEAQTKTEDATNE